MRIKEFIQFIELLLNELLQSKRILAFPNGSNFGKAKVTPELQKEYFIFFYFNIEEIQRHRGLSYKFKNAVTVYLCVLFRKTRERLRVKPAMRFIGDRSRMGHVPIILRQSTLNTKHYTLYTIH